MDKKYSLMTLSAVAVAEQCIGRAESRSADGVYTIELYRGGNNIGFGSYQELVQSEDIHSDCPFFYQAERLSKELYGASETTDCETSELLLRSVVFLDCGEIPFSADETEDEKRSYGKNAHRAKLLAVFTGIIAHGIYIKFDESTEPVLFKPSDRSASMSRSGKLSLVRADGGADGVSLYDALEESLLLGMDLARIQLCLTKYYAYRGLYLSDSTRLEAVFDDVGGDGLLLNEKTVIVIPDDISPGKNMRVITSALKSKDGDEWKFPTPTTLKAGDRRAEINRFDGEGLVCPSYAALINRQLLDKRYDGEDARKPGHISSFQIRLPMGKGMLHEVDFHAALIDMLAFSIYGKAAEELTDDEQKDILELFAGLEVKDQFDQFRKVSEAKIILTASMFKAAKWIKMFCKQNKLEDPMRFYFEGMKKYHHSLYIANDSSMLRDSGTVRLNYQFLNTLMLDEDELRGLFGQVIADEDEQTAETDDGEQNEKDIVQADTDHDSGEQYLLRLSGKYQSLVEADDRFAGIGRVSRMLARGRLDALNEKLRGRLPVKGVCRFLSRDLLALVVHIAKLINTTGKKKYLFMTDELKLWCLPTETIYMPSYDVPETAENGETYLAMLRSPHLSRNEQCLVRLLGGDEDAGRIARYEKYFSALSSVVMVNYASLAPMALAGADFDGDLVKIISDNRIVDAVRRGVYPDERNGRPARTMPVILIPSLAQKDKTIGHSIDFDVLKGSFTSRIGLISNYTVSLGKKEYAKEGGGKAVAGSCVFSTILAGLEIDSVKTGRKPALGEFFGILKTGGRKRRYQRDRYLRRMDMLTSIPDYYRTAFERSADDKGREYISLTAYGQGENVRHTELKYDDGCAVLDKLPWLYLDERARLANEADNSNNGTVDIRDLLYGTKPDGVVITSEQRLIDDFEQIVRAYCRVLRTASREYGSEQALKRAQYVSRILTILKQQYDDVYEPFDKSRSDDGTVYDKAAAAFELVNKCLPDRKCAGRCLGRLISKRWQYTLPEKRSKRLASLIGLQKDEIDADIAELLCRFDHSGYRLLYYMVKSIYFSPPTPVREQGPSDDDSDKNCASGSEYFKRYRAVWQTAKARRQTKSIWSRELRRVCREDILALTEKHCHRYTPTGQRGKPRRLSKETAMDTALWLYASLPPSADPSEAFLWDIFSTSEILRCTVPEKAQQGTIEEDKQENGHA